MDPLTSANLATHLPAAPRTRRPRRRRPEADPLPAADTARDGLAWSALPHAPQIAALPPRTDVIRQRLATVLRQAAARIDPSRPATPLPTTSG